MLSANKLVHSSNLTLKSSAKFFTLLKLPRKASIFWYASITNAVFSISSNVLVNNLSWPYLSIASIKLLAVATPDSSPSPISNICAAVFCTDGVRYDKNNSPSSPVKSIPFTLFSVDPTSSAVISVSVAAKYNISGVNSSPCNLADIPVAITFCTTSGSCLYTSLACLSMFLGVDAVATLPLTSNCCPASLNTLSPSVVITLPSAFVSACLKLNLSGNWSSMYPII